MAGAVARYTCNDGYNVVGIASRRCIDQQGWSGSAPICQRKSVNDLTILPQPFNLKLTIAKYTSTACKPDTFPCSCGLRRFDSTTKRTVDGDGYNLWLPGTL